MPSPDLAKLKAATVGENEKHGLRRIKDHTYEGWLDAANRIEAEVGDQCFMGTPFSSIPIDHKFILELRDAIAELERLRGEVAKAKTLGAVEQLCTDPDKYYVYSQRDAKAGYAGGSIVWWREGGHGYARDLKGAGVFTIEDYLKGYPNPSHCVYVPCNRVVDAAFKSETLVWEKNLPKAKQLAKEIETRAAELRKELA